MSRIGALVITRNEADNIEDCLRRLDFCDERVVVDSFSDDATIERALPLVDRLYQRSFCSYADQKNWGLAQLTTPWVLIVDADERVPPQLAQELQSLAVDSPTDGFWIYRRNFFFGHEIRGAGWSRDKVLRFFRRDRGRYPDVPVHEEVKMVAGSRVERCRHRLLHYSYTDWEGTFERLVRYSTLGAQAARERGRQVSPWSVVTAPIGRFLRQYVLQGGFRDGLPGYIVCSLGAVGVFLRRAKLVTGEDPDAQGPKPTAGTAAAQVRTIKGPPPRAPGAEAEVAPGGPPSTRSQGNA